MSSLHLFKNAETSDLKLKEVYHVSMRNIRAILRLKHSNQAVFGKSVTAEELEEKHLGLLLAHERTVRETMRMDTRLRKENLR